MKVFKKIGSFFSNLFNSRSKRIDYALEFCSELKTFLSGSIDDGIITGVAVASKSAGTILTALDKGLVSVLPEVVNALIIMNASDDATVGQQNEAIYKAIEEIKNVELSDKKKAEIDKYQLDNKTSFIEAVEILILINKKS